MVSAILNAVMVMIGIFALLLFLLLSIFALLPILTIVFGLLYSLIHETKEYIKKKLS